MTQNDISFAELRDLALSGQLYGKKAVKALGPVNQLVPFIQLHGQLKVGDIVQNIVYSATYGLYGAVDTDIGAYTRYVIDNNCRFAILSDAEMEEVQKERLAKAKTNLRLVNADRGQNTNLYIGSDPEIFVVNAKGIIIPAFSFLPAENERKYIPELAKVDTWPFWDGFQAEFNVPQKYCHAWLVDQIQAGLGAVYRAARKHNPKAQLSYKSVLDIPYEMMQAVQDVHAELGCSPSLNVYGETKPIDIPNPRDLAIRFAGFHIHYGYGKKPKAEIAARVRAIDKIAGVVSVSVLAGLEDVRRRAFYGRAGEYRLPKHGLEYRALSSTVMVHPLVTHFFLDLARFSSHLVQLKLDQLWDVPGGDAQVQHIMNDYDVDEARKLMKLNRPMLESMVDITYGLTGSSPSYDSSGKLKKRFEWLKALMFEGAKEHVPLDMTKNWYLDNPTTFWGTHCQQPNASIAVLNTDKLGKG